MINSLSVEEACLALSNEQCVVTPSESVYGISAIATSAKAVQKIIQIKARPSHMGLIVVTDCWSAVQDWVANKHCQLPEWLRPWPDNTSVIFSASACAPEHLITAEKTLCIRCTKHPVLQALCQHVGPIISTSANRHGQPSSRQITDLDWLETETAGLVSGQLGEASQPSAIIDRCSQQKKR